MKKKFLHLLIIFVMTLQLIPVTFVDAIAKDTSVVQNEYIMFSSEQEADVTLSKDVDIPASQAKLHVSIYYNEELKEEKYLLFNADHNPGKLTITALDNYAIESIKVDDNEYKNDALAFDRESGFLSKEVVIKVKDYTKEVEKEIQPAVEKAAVAPKADVKATASATPEGANFKIISGTGESNDPYIIDISCADIYLPGDEAIRDNYKNNDSDGPRRYSYTFEKDYDYIYEAMLNMGGDGYTLLRTYGINGLVNNKFYRIKDPMEGSSLVWVSEKDFESAKVTYDVNTHIKNGFNNKWSVHYSQHNDSMDINIHYVFDGKENTDFKQSMKIKEGKNDVNTLGFPSDLKVDGVTYHYNMTAMSMNGKALTEINVTNNKMELYVHYNSEKVKVSFNPNGGYFSFLDDSTKEYTIRMHTALKDKISDPQKLFSRTPFLGWYTQDDVKFEKNMIFNQDTTFYAKWGETRADFYLIKKGQKKPINNEPDDAYKYFHYGQGYLVENPTAVNNEAKVRDQITQEPEKRDITDGEYCVVDNVTTPNCKGYDKDQYEAVWYRTIKDGKKVWHVDGYLREKTKVNLEFNLISAGKTEYDYFTNTDVERNTKLDAWPSGTPAKVNVKNETYVFSGWYKDEERTEKASLDTVYGEELVGKTVKLYAAYTKTSKLTLKVEGSDVTYDGKEHGLKSVIPSISENVTIQYATENPDNEKSWSTTEPKSTAICDKTVYVKAVSDQYADSDYVKSYIKIAQRNITLTAASQSRPYTGEALSNETVTISEKGLAENHNLSTVVQGSITKKGSVDNVIKSFEIYDANHQTVTNNYKVTTHNGTLTITEASAEDNAITVADTTVAYDGVKHSVGTIEMKNPNASLWYSKNGVDGWETIQPFYTEAGTYDVYVKACDSNYFDSNVAHAKIVIQERNITLYANSLTKKYNGKPLYAEGYSMEGTLADKQTIEVKVSGEATNVKDKGVSKISEYVIKDAKGITTSKNYHVETEDGTLSITPASKEKNKISVKEVNVTYDGKPHGVGEITKDQPTSEIRYLVDGKWTKEAPTFTEAKINTVRVKAVNPNYEDSQEVEAIITILPRAITLTAKSLSKDYDGTPLVAKGFDMSGTLADEQEIKVSVTGSITNVIEHGISKIDTYSIQDAKKNDTRSNYIVIPVDGTLKINKAAASLNVLNIRDVNMVYDGYSHGLTVTASQNGSTILYSKDKSKWVSELKYLNVCDTTVYVKATNPNYKDTEAESGTIEITQRPITVTSASATKIFDGTPLTANSFNVSEGTMAREQKVSAKVTGTITKAGKSNNTISDIQVLDGKEYVTTNYKITPKTGILEVTKETTKNTIEVDNIKETYNGNEHMITSVRKNIKDAEILYATDIKQAKWVTESPKFTEAGDHIVYVKAVHDDYEDSAITTAHVIIDQRKVIIRAKSDTKKYDGTALTNRFYEVSKDGIVEGQKESVTISGSQTVVGDCENKITSVIIKAGDRDTTLNYEIERFSGNLKVEHGLQIHNQVIMKDLETTYDGNPKSIEDAQKSVSSATVYYTTNKDDNSSWSKEKPSFDKADSYVIYAKAVDANYEESAIMSATLKINKRPITLIAGSKTRAYNGTALTLDENEYTINANTSLAPKQTISSVTLGGSITDYGTIDSTIANVKIKDANKNETTDNYAPSYQTGTLQITKAAASLNTVSAQDATDVYDGEGHTVLNVTSSVTGAKIEYSKDGTDWQETLPTFTEKGKYTVHMKATHKNYEDSIVTKAYETITPRPITITAGSKSAEYNALKPLTCNDFSVSENGLVKEQAPVVVIKGSQSIVGESANTIESASIKSKDGNTDVSSNYAITKKDGSLKVTKATGNQNKVNAEDESYMYDGNPHIIENINTAKENSTLYFYDEVEKKWTTNQPVFTEVGDYDVRIKAEHHDYADTEEKTVVLHITKRPITLKVEDATKIYDGTAFTSNAFTVTSEKKPVGNQKVSVITNGTITNVGETSNAITSYTVMDGVKNVTENYAITTNPGKLVVNKASNENNTLTAKGISEEYDGESHTFNAPETNIKTATVWYSFDKDKWTTIKPSSIDVCNSHIYIKATDDNYDESKIIEIDMKVTARPITITPKDAEMTYTGTALKASNYTISNKKLVNEHTATVELLGEQINAGDSKSSIGLVVIRDKDNKKVTTNYAVTKAEGLLHVDKADAKENPITVESTTVEYDGAKHGLTNVSAPKENTTIYYSTDNSSWDDTPTLRRNVTKTKVYVKAENANYNNSFGEGYIEITQRSITFKASSANKIYDGTPLKSNDYAIVGGSLAPNQKEKITVEGSQTVVGGSENKISSYKVFMGEKDTTPNYIVTLETGNLTVSSADGNAIEFSNYVEAYDGNSHGLTNVKSALAGSTIQYSLDKENWQTAPYEYKDYGIHEVWVRAVKENYKPSTPIQGTINITKRDITIQAATDARPYNGTPLTNSNYKTTNLVNGEEINGVVVEGTITDCGSVPNVVSGGVITNVAGEDVTNNYNPIYANGELTISKAPASSNKVTVETKDAIYDGGEHGLESVKSTVETGTTFYYAKSNDENATWTDETPKYVNAGTYPVFVKAVNKNYETAKPVETKIYIAKRDAKIQANKAEKTYNGKDPEFTANLLNVVKGEEDLFVYTLARATGEDAGTYAISVKDVKELDNYKIETEGAKFTIHKAPASSNKVTVETKDAIYDGGEHGLKSVKSTVETGTTFYYAKSNDENATWTDETPKYVNAGTYPVFVKAVNKNYETAKPVETKIYIAKRDAKIQANKAEKTYNGEDPKLTANLLDVVKGEEDLFVYTLERATGEDAGTYAISVKDVKELANYNIGTEGAEFTIHKAPASSNKVTVENATATYDGENHTVGKVETTVEGAKVYYSVDGKEWSIEKPVFTEVGEYPVYVQARDENYEESKVVESKVVITKREITITASSVKRAFNKEALSSNAYTISKDGLVKEQAIHSIQVAGSITNVGTAKNTVSDARIMSGKEDKTKNYKITYIEGVLEVTKASSDDNTVRAEDTKAVYDGEDHTIGKVETSVEDSEVFYSKDGETWTKEVPSFTEAGNHEVFIKAVNENYEDSKIFTGNVGIEKRSITITADSATKVYDTLPLVRATYSLSENALVKDQKVEVTITGEQLVVGTSKNEITTAIITDGKIEKTENYKIELVDGLLSVTAAITPITPNTPNPQLPDTGRAVPIFVPNPAVVVVQPKVTPKTNGEKEVVKKKETPKAANKGTWALCNLLFAGGTLVLGIILLLSKLKKDDDEDEEENHVMYTRKKWLRLVTSATAILSVVVFCLTEDITLKMVFVDSWTVWMVVFLIVQAVSFYFGRKWKEEENQEETVNVE